MKFPQWLDVYGHLDFRGDCPQETLEQVTFFSRLRREYPALGKIAYHPKNEGRRSGRDFNALAMDKAMGLSPGASDIIIPGAPAFVCEMKRRDPTKSKWQEGQIEYLETAKKEGAFCCVALGADAAMEAVKKWLDLRSK